MTSLAAPKVALQLVPVPKPVIYAGLTGEMLKNTGMQDNQQIQAIQQAVSEQLIEAVTVLAPHPDGHVDTFTLTMKPFAPDETVALQLENGKSYLEALDVSLAAAVQYASNLIARQGLTPRFRVTWSAKARTTPGLIASTIQRLNLKVEPEPPRPMPAAPPMPDAWAPPPPPPRPAQRYPQTVRTYTPPPVPPGHVLKPVLTIKPAKDTGVSFVHAKTCKAP